MSLKVVRDLHQENGTLNVGYFGEFAIVTCQLEGGHLQN